MGKKSKKKGKKKPKVKKVDPPYSFHIDNFPTNSGQCALHLYDQVDVNFQEIEIEVKVSRHPISRKPQFDLLIVKSKEEARPHGMYMGEELLPFPVYFLETKQTLRVEPLRTGGQQPFIMVDPDTGAERSIVPPYFVHYQPTNRKRYVLDLRKFTNGKFKFKDPNTGEEIVVDITQRVDPLSGLPMYGEDKNPDRVFIGTIKNGEAYVVKDPVTEDIEVFEGNGQPALDYRTTYDSGNNKTRLLDDKGEEVMVLDGKHTIQLKIPEEVLNVTEQENKEDKASKGKKDVLDDADLGFDLLEKGYEGENALTGNKERILKPSQHKRKPASSKNKKKLEDGVLGFDLLESGDDDDDSPDMFTKIMDKAMKDVDGDKEYSIGESEELNSHDLTKYKSKPSSMNTDKRGNVTFDVKDPSEQPQIRTDPNTGAIQIIDSKGNVIKTLDGYTLKEDPVSGTMRLFDQNGDPVDINALIKDATSQQPHIHTDPNTGAIQIIDSKGNIIKTLDGYTLKEDPESGTMRLFDQNGDPVNINTLIEDATSQQPYIRTDPKTGTIKLVDSKGNVIKILDGYTLKEDPESGTMRLFDQNGDPVDIKNLMKDTKAMVPDKSDSQRPASADSRAGTGMKLPLLTDKERDYSKTEEEKYFASMKTEDAWTILNDVKTLDDVTKKMLLQGLIQVIEFEKDFVDCAMKTKLDVEREYIDELYKDKAVRQTQFICETVKSTPNTYDNHEVKKEIQEKLERENQYILDQVNEKIAVENELVFKAMQRELKGNKKTIIERSNTNCYRQCKQILMKYFAQKLSQENAIVMKELCERFLKEREALLKEQ